MQNLHASIFKDTGCLSNHESRNPFCGLALIVVSSRPPWKRIHPITGGQKPQGYKYCTLRFMAPRVSMRFLGPFSSLTLGATKYFAVRCGTLIRAKIYAEYLYYVCLSTCIDLSDFYCSKRTLGEQVCCLTSSLQQLTKGQPTTLSKWVNSSGLTIFSCPLSPTRRVCLAWETRRTPREGLTSAFSGASQCTNHTHGWATYSTPYNG